MIARIINYIKFLGKVNIRQFYYYNYFCKSVIRLDQSKLIPYKNAIIDIDLTAKIYLFKGDIEIGCDKLKKSKVETCLRLRENAIWNSVGGNKISYGTTLEILKDAVLNSKFFTMNSNCTMIVAKRIDFGQDVMIGRNVIIYDSDFHQLLDIEGRITNYALPVVIGDHVWLATNTLVTKGARIGSGSVVGANSIVNCKILDNQMYYVKNNPIIRNDYGKWKRERP